MTGAAASLELEAFFPELTPYITPQEMARRTGLSSRTMLRKLHERRIHPHLRQGRQGLYRRSEVADVLAEIAASPPFRVAIAHRKGGQAKTTTAFYLARELAARGHRVVLRDTDSQRSLTEVLLALGAQQDRDGRVQFLRRVVLVPDGCSLPFRPDYEIVDTPPALDDSLPGIRRADAVVIPAVIDLQAVLALRQMLGYLRETMHLQPNLQIVGVLPTRLFPRRQVLYRFLDEMRSLCKQYNVPMLEPVLEDGGVAMFSMAGRRWSPLAERVLEAGRQTRATRLQEALA
jgi:chromosome partitioning protein